MSLGDRYGHAQAVPAVLNGLSSPEDVRHAARRFVASRAVDAVDCGELLDALGLGFTAEEIAAFKRSATDDTVIQAVSETEGRA